MELISRPILTDPSRFGTEVAGPVELREGASLIVSPYDVPDSISVFRDRTLRNSGIRFTYILDEPTEKKCLSKSLHAEIGRKSARIYSIVAKIPEKSNTRLSQVIASRGNVKSPTSHSCLWWPKRHQHEFSFGKAPIAKQRFAHRQLERRTKGQPSLIRVACVQQTRSWLPKRLTSRCIRRGREYSCLTRSPARFSSVAFNQRGRQPPELSMHRRSESTARG